MRQDLIGQIIRLDDGFLLTMNGATVACPSAKELGRRVAAMASAAPPHSYEFKPQAPPLADYTPPYQAPVSYQAPPPPPPAPAGEDRLAPQRHNLAVLALACAEGKINDQQFQDAQATHYPDLPPDLVAEALDAAETEVYMGNHNRTVLSKMEQEPYVTEPSDWDAAAFEQHAEQGWEIPSVLVKSCVCPGCFRSAEGALDKCGPCYGGMHAHRLVVGKEYGNHATAGPSPGSGDVETGTVGASEQAGEQQQKVPVARRPNRGREVTRRHRIRVHPGKNDSPDFNEELAVTVRETDTVTEDRDGEVEL